MRVPDSDVRERIRLNVGYGGQTDPHHRAVAIAPRRLIMPGRGAGAPTSPTPPPVGGLDLSLGVPGRPIALALNLLAGTRVIAASPILSFQYIIRRITIVGNAGFNSAFSFRILVAGDNDETATATPTGLDVIRFNSTVFGAEDQGLHSNINQDSTEIEPWFRQTDTPSFIKLKAHNATAGTLGIGIFLDIDELPTGLL